MTKHALRGAWRSPGISLGRPRFLLARSRARVACLRLEDLKLRCFFEDFALDTDRRELYRGEQLVAVEPKVFDLLVYVIANHERVVSKDDLIATVWKGRIVSKSALTVASMLLEARLPTAERCSG